VNRLSGLTLLLAILSAAFFLLLVFFRSPFPPEPLMSYQDALDLLTPVVLLPVYWLIFRRSAKDPAQHAEELAFVILGALWVMGHGMHLSANSIANLLAAGGPVPGPATDVAALTHLYDEVLSHYLWHAAVIGLAVLLIYREWHRPTGQETAWRPTSVGGLIYGFTLFSIFLEGGTVSIGMPFTAGVLVFGLLWGRGVVAQRPVLAFFAIAGGVALVLFIGWGVYWGGFPQFSDVGLI
jgi:hypothetical protein